MVADEVIRQWPALWDFAVVGWLMMTGTLAFALAVGPLGH